ncbi:hypothetical protein HMPREF1624_07174 [Sporothrix schenckii ATCC 58251]|uniref:DUF2293 domain-containing protein n=1 Tax=Sporothrix schenckii (strain ATCC 58251 / de Perez 2211183) TaxID=1391915 RepID=U7PP33_SPOS1|nr:hypothetical protein HMPREF1624_07174 [Sporothrix schenckii ATCC 58251]
MGREKKHSGPGAAPGAHAKERHKKRLRAQTISNPVVLNARPEVHNLKSKHHSYYEIVENKDKKKKLEFKITSRRTPPPGFEFVPIGNPELTKACKELSREHDAMIFIVSNGTGGGLSQQMNRVGHHIRQGIVEEARREVSDNGNSSDDHAQKAVEGLCLDVLVKWRGDEETGRDQLDEILREVIVISDSEGEEDGDEDEDDEADSSGVESGDLAAEPSYLPYPAVPQPRTRKDPETALELRHTRRPLVYGERATWRDEPDYSYARPTRPYMQDLTAAHRARRGFKRGGDGSTLQPLEYPTRGPIQTLVASDTALQRSPSGDLWCGIAHVHWQRSKGSPNGTTTLVQPMTIRHILQPQVLGRNRLKPVRTMRRQHTNSTLHIQHSTH